MGLTLALSLQLWLQGGYSLTQSAGIPQWQSEFDMPWIPRFASKARCEHCSGTGFYNVLREVVKHYRRGESVIKEEWVKELCQHCHGKGEASTACRGCKGKGIVLDEKRTRFCVLNELKGAVRVSASDIRR